MSEIKWIKINTNIFDDEVIELIEQMPSGDTLLIIWFKLLIKAGQINDNGYIYLKEDLPYTDEMLAVIFKRPLSIVRIALKTFQQFGMIEISSANEILIRNWEKHQNTATMDKIRQDTRERVRRHRERQKQAHLTVIDGFHAPSATSTTEGISLPSNLLSSDFKQTLLSICPDEQKLEEYIQKFNTLPQKPNDSKNIKSRILSFVKKLAKDDNEERTKAEQRKAADFIHQTQRKKAQAEALSLKEEQAKLKDAICDKQSAIEYFQTYYPLRKMLEKSTYFKEISQKYDVTFEDVLCKNKS